MQISEFFTWVNEILEWGTTLESEQPFQSAPVMWEWDGWEETVVSQLGPNQAWKLDEIESD